MLRNFIKSAEPINKSLYSLLSYIEIATPNKIIFDRSVQIQAFPGQRNIGLVANQNIHQQERIFAVSSTQAITGFEIIGADQQTNVRLSDISEKIATKYHESNSSQYYFTIQLLKILFQIYAQKSDSGFPLYHYANFLYDNYPKDVPLNWSNQIKDLIFSSHLRKLVEAQRTYFYALAGDLDRSALPLLKYEELLKSIGIVRSRSLNFLPSDPKNITKDTVTILCPCVDLINHSFDPNCQIEGHYNSFENDSFVEVRAVKDIQKGEELTLNYGNMSNYDFLMKFGFLNENNPFDSYSLQLDFDGFIQYTTQVFDLKHKIFSMIPDFQLDKIPIYRDRIDANALANLRVYFLTDEDVKENKEIFSYTPRDFKVKVSDTNEKHIYELIIANVKRDLTSVDGERRKVLDKVKLPANIEKGVFHDLNALKANKEKIKDYNLYNMIQIGLEEENTLKKNLDFCNRQLQSLTK